MLNQPRWWKRLLRPDLLLLLVTLTAGTAGALLANRYLGARADATDAAIRSRYQTQAVVVAAADLPKGATLQAGLLAARQMPVEFLPSDAVPAARGGELIGGQTAIDIRRGMPVVHAALATATRAPRLSSVLGATGRALTIAVDEVNSQAGNLQPGDWVDIYFSRNEDGRAVLVQLLQRVQVLAAGSALAAAGAAPDGAGADTHYGTITLGLAAADAERVVLAQQSGSLAVVLRASGDQTLTPSVMRNSRELLPQVGSAGRSVAGSRVEILVGGSGGLTPERSWLPIGQAGTDAAGDRS